MSRDVVKRIETDAVALIVFAPFALTLTGDCATMK
jgi:hypothetical protein